MLASQLDKHPVLDVSSASTVGRVDDVIIDPAARRVVGFTIGKASGSGDWLAWDRMKALGPDAATVDDAGAITARPDDAHRGLRAGKILSGRVLTDQGRELGTLADVDFDPTTGEVLTLHVSSGQTLPSTAMLGMGTYATMISDSEAGA